MAVRAPPQPTVAAEGGLSMPGEHSWLTEQWRKRGILSMGEDVVEAVQKLAGTSWVARRHKKLSKSRGGRDAFARKFSREKGADAAISRISDDNNVRRKSLAITASGSPEPSRFRSFIESNIPTPTRIASKVTLASNHDSSPSVQINVISEDTEVYLVVYDLSCCWNALCHPLGVGAYHSGIEIGGLEYMYDGTSSLLADSLHQEVEAVVEGQCGVRWREPFHLDPAFLGRMRILARIPLGKSRCGASDSHNTLQRTASLYWIADEYHFLEHNCHHWSMAAASELGVNPPPRWLNRLAELLSSCSGVRGGAPRPISPGVRNTHTHNKHCSDQFIENPYPPRRISGSPLMRRSPYFFRGTAFTLHDSIRRSGEDEPLLSEDND